MSLTLTKVPNYSVWWNPFLAFAHIFKPCMSISEFMIFFLNLLLHLSKWFSSSQLFISYIWGSLWHLLLYHILHQTLPRVLSIIPPKWISKTSHSFHYYHPQCKLPASLSTIMVTASQLVSPSPLYSNDLFKKKTKCIPPGMESPNVFPFQIKSNADP